MRSLRSITDSARRMIDDVMKHPNDFPRVERALTGHLAHVETITDSLTNVREVREVDPAVLARLEQTLADLDQLFKDYREKLVEADELELEVRMDLLENELQRLGGRKQPVRN